MHSLLSEELTPIFTYALSELVFKIIIGTTILDTPSIEPLVILLLSFLYTNKLLLSFLSYQIP